MIKFLSSFFAKNTRFSQNRQVGSWLQDKIIFWNLILTVFFIIILVLVILIKVNPGDERLVLHYTVLTGPDVLDKGWYLYQLPVLGVAFLVYNIFLARKFYSFEPFASYILMVAATLVSLILFSAGVAISYL